MLREEHLNVLFLVETDTKSIKTHKDYKFEGFTSVLQKTEKVGDSVRVIALVDEETCLHLKGQNGQLITTCMCANLSE